MTSESNSEKSAILSKLQSLLHSLSYEHEQQEQAQPSSTTILQSLKELAKPDFIMDVLCPFLFQHLTSSNVSEMNLGDDDITETSLLGSATALTLLVWLVSKDSGTFLKPASRAVRRAVCQLSLQQQQQGDLMNDEASESLMFVSDNLLRTILEQVTGWDVEVATNATQTIVVCCRVQPSLILPTLEGITRSWKRAMTEQHRSSDNTNKTMLSTLCVRYASVVIDLVMAIDVTPITTTTITNDGMSVMAVAREKTVALGLFINMLNDTTDPLVQMSMLDLLEKLANQTSDYQLNSNHLVTNNNNHHHEHVCTWLFSHDVLDPLLTMAGGHVEDGEPDPILGGPALRVVTSLCKVAGNVSSIAFTSPDNPHGQGGQTDNQIILTAFHRALQKFDTQTELDRLAVVDAISSLAMASLEALSMVLQNAQTQRSWMTLHVAQPKLKSAILVSVALVLEHQYNSRSQDQMGSSENSNNEQILKRQLYAAVGRVNGAQQDSTDLMLSLARSPLVEIRLAAYRILTAVATSITTGAQLLLQNAEFFSFLLSGSLESNSGDNTNTMIQNNSQKVIERTKEGREAKYGLVKAVYNSNARGLLADAIVKQLETVVQRGPYFVPTQTWELATE